MERQGFDIPLLIGGATTSRVHTAVKIDPALPARPDRLCHRRQPRRGRGVGLLSPGSGARLCRRDARRNMSRIAKQPCRSAGRQEAPDAGDARANALKIDCRALHAAAAEIPRQRDALTDYDLAELARYIDWTPFFQTWELAGPLSRRSSRRQVGRGGARALSPTRRRCSKQIVDGEMAHGARRDRLLAGQRRRRRHRGLCRRGAATPIAACTPCASRWRKREGRRQLGAGRFHRADRRRRADYIGGFAVTAGHRRGGDRRRVQGAPTTIIPPSWCRRWPTAWRKPLPSACMQRVRTEFWGYAPDETFDHERPDRARTIAASARRPAIRPSPTTPRRRRCSICWTPSSDRRRS